MKTIIPFAPIFALLIAAVPASAQMLKCIGKDGKVEYAAQCPSGTTEQQTGIKNDPKSAPPQQKSLAERDAEFRKRQIEGAEAQKKSDQKSAESTTNKEACENARANLKGLQEGQRIARTDPKTGQLVFVQDEERPAEIAKAQRLVENNCK